MVPFGRPGAPQGAARDGPPRPQNVWPGRQRRVTDWETERTLWEVLFNRGRAEITSDPTSGIEAVGTVSNKSDIEQTELVLYAIARKGGKIVAAGRGLIPKLKVGGKTETYHIFFIGNPSGADVTVIAPPVNLK